MLIKKLHAELDSGGFLGKTLMDWSKAITIYHMIY